jgi:O-acetyl-ADP-ribose deacetylase (regulator of RNase III)
MKATEVTAIDIDGGLALASPASTASTAASSSPASCSASGGVGGFDAVLGQVASRAQEEVTRELRVDASIGLSELSVRERQREYGLNELEGEEEVRRSCWIELEAVVAMA